MVDKVSLQTTLNVKLFAFRPDTTMLEAALTYARCGWPIFPLQPLNKIPYRGSHGFYDATLDIERIRNWWKRNPHSMIGLATGLLSGVFVVDLDRKEADKD